MKQIITKLNKGHLLFWGVALIVAAFNYDAPDIQTIVADIIQILSPAKGFEGIDTPFDNFTNL